MTPSQCLGLPLPVSYANLLPCWDNVATPSIESTCGEMYGDSIGSLICYPGDVFNNCNHLKSPADFWAWELADRSPPVLGPQHLSPAATGLESPLDGRLSSNWAR